MGHREPLYKIDDALDEDGGAAFVSNDGRSVVYVNLADGAEGVSADRDGCLIRRLTAFEVTQCDERRERCNLVYTNGEQVIDQQRSFPASGGSRKIFKAGVSEEERFLNEFSVFSSGDTVYLTDSGKRVHLFSLVTGTAGGPVAFENLYPSMRRVARVARTETDWYDYPDFALSSLAIAGGGKAADALARHLRLKAVAEDDDPEFRVHTFMVSGSLYRDGRFEVDQLEVFGNLQRQKVLDFFASSRFDTRPIPAPCDWWYAKHQSFEFRNPDEAAARREKEAYLLEQQKELQERLAAERIEGVYIPRDLGECFLELDKMLAEVWRNEMKALPKRQDMIQYHLGLGMGLRNSWGLWRGSRLQKYFTDRGVKQPDDMSAIILDYYYDWLRGDTAGWKNWDNEWRTRIPQIAPPPPPPPPPPPKRKK